MSTLQFDAATRTRLLIPMSLDIDPTGSTPEIKVDTIWHPAEWIGLPTQTGGRWFQTARTTGYFAGPQVVAPAGATVLAVGPHNTKTRVSKGADILAAQSTVIAVLTSAG